MQNERDHKFVTTLKATSVLVVIMSILVFVVGAMVDEADGRPLPFGFISSITLCA